MAEFNGALDRLNDLTGAVAAQESHAEVFGAVTALRLAVSRIYGGKRPKGAGNPGARPLILDHLAEHVGEWIQGDELAIVSGIGEWARRVRELRVEDGYEIDEDAGRYRLVVRAPNLRRRARWLTVTAVRDQSGTAVDRIRSLFEQLVGEAVTVDELDRVARGKDGARVARELRDGEQWPVEFAGDAADLGPGEYRLASASAAHLLHPAQTLFSEDLRARVFRRDGYSCWTCRLDRASADASAVRPFYLVVRHVGTKPDDLTNLSVDQLTDLARLATSCNRCFRV